MIEGRVGRMSEGGWTPGPWQVEEHMPGGYAVRSPDGMVAGIIAFREDAQLFALAPEMAELLGEIADTIQRRILRIDKSLPTGIVFKSEGDIDGRIRLLLARARGET